MFIMCVCLCTSGKLVRRPNVAASWNFTKSNLKEAKKVTNNRLIDEEAEGIFLPFAIT